MPLESDREYDRLSAYAFARQQILLAAQDKRKSLSLVNLCLETLPPEIGNCKELETLVLVNNGLSDIPQEIQRCAKLERLYLHRNPELGIPPEILGPILAESNLLGAADPKAILDYYFARKYSGGKPLNEVKLVLVGRGGSGKTSLVNRSP